MAWDWTHVRMSGPLEAYAAGFAAELERLGYTTNSTADQVRLFAHLSRWLAENGLGGDQLTAAVQTAFLARRRAAGYTLWLSPKALVPMMAHLRRIGVAPPEPVVPMSPTEELLERYRRYLTLERGVTPTTAAGYIHTVRPFLEKRRCRNGAPDLSGLTARDITEHVRADIVARSPRSAKLVVTALRSLLQFLHLAGILDRPLSSAVPKVPNIRLAGLPRGLEPDQVEKLLGSCDRVGYTKLITKLRTRGNSRREVHRASRVCL